MAKFFDIRLTQEKENASHIPAAVLLIVITFVPFVTQSGLIALIPVYLGIYEAIVHIAGIKLHKMKKPYTPGMITALLLLVASVFSLVIFSTQQIAHGAEFAWGVLLMFLCFFIMQRIVIAIFGLGYEDLAAIIKKKFKKEL